MQRIRIVEVDWILFHGFYFLYALQLCPLQRPIKWESVVTFSSPSSQSFTFPVKGGLVIEVTVAQFWSSGVGSHESTVVDLEVFRLHKCKMRTKLSFAHLYSLSLSLPTCGWWLFCNFSPICGDFLQYACSIFMFFCYTNKKPCSRLIIISICYLEP